MDARALARRLFVTAALAAPAWAHASIFKGEALDTAANVLSWFVLVVMPFAAIGIFLYIHVLPEVIAERRQHPHKDSIKVLCILSLFFGGLLWPFAWLWAYTRPVGYRMIYGTEKHEDYYVEEAARARSGALTVAEIEHLREELDGMAERGVLSPRLKAARAQLAELAASPPVPVAAEPAPAAGGKA
jgi:CBS domain containing-hemolysin-like protein